MKTEELLEDGQDGWDRYPSSVQAELDIERYMDEVGLGEYSEGLNERYLSILQDSIRSGGRPDILIVAAVRDRYWLQHSELTDKLDVSRKAVRDAADKLGFDGMNPLVLKSRVENYREDLGDRYGDMIESYGKEVPDARPREIATVIKLAENDGASAVKKAKMLNGGEEKVERAVDFLEENTDFSF